MFSAHGSFDIALYKNVFVAVCEGAWNLETAASYEHQSTKLLMPVIATEPWAQITVISDWELATPDVEPVMNRMVKQATHSGLHREAVVNTSGLIKLEQFNRTIKVAHNDFQRRFFSTYEDAADWLKQEGFHPPPNSELKHKHL